MSNGEEPRKLRRADSFRFADGNATPLPRAKRPAARCFISSLPVRAPPFIPRTMNYRTQGVSLLLSLFLSALASAADGPLQARTWDFETTIPAGGYRAQKPIDLTGDWDAKIERGAILDGIEFHGRAGVQRWRIEGTF